MPLRVIFMGTPEFSVPALNALAASQHEIICVYTQPPRPAGRRGLEPTRSPVHLAADQAGIDVRTPENFKQRRHVDDFSRLNADVAFVIAYGLLLPQPILAAPRLGCLNAHASLLPRWRGAAPIQRAIEAGDAETGVDIMQMDAGLDTGPLALREILPIGSDMTGGELHNGLSAVCARLAVAAIDRLEAGTLVFTSQPADGACYAKKIDKSQTRIDWRLPALQLHDRIRAFSPFPGCWCELPVGGGLARVKILASAVGNSEGLPGTVLDDRLTIACGQGSIALTHLQRAGKQPVSADAFTRGNPIAAGTVLL